MERSLIVTLGGNEVLNNEGARITDICVCLRCCREANAIQPRFGYIEFGANDIYLLERHSCKQVKITYMSFILAALVLKISRQKGLCIECQCKTNRRISGKKSRVSLPMCLHCFVWLCNNSPYASVCSYFKVIHQFQMKRICTIKYKSILQQINNSDREESDSE